MRIFIFPLSIVLKFIGIVLKKVGVKYLSHLLFKIVGTKDSSIGIEKFNNYAKIVCWIGASFIKFLSFGHSTSSEIYL